MDDVRLLFRYVMYLIRWQLSTPILYFCISFLPMEDELSKTIIANLIGGLLFFWVDKIIFNKRSEKIGYFKQR